MFITYWEALTFLQAFSFCFVLGFFCLHKCKVEPCSSIQPYSCSQMISKSLSLASGESQLIGICTEEDWGHWTKACAWDFFVCFVSHNSERKVKILTSEFFGGFFPQKERILRIMSEKRLFSEKVGIQKKKSDLGLFSENVRILNFWEKPKNSKTEKYEVLLLFKMSFYFGGIYTPFFKML